MRASFGASMKRLHVTAPPLPSTRSTNRLGREYRLSMMSGCYLAYSTARVSRITVTLIWPGYSRLSSTFLAMSRDR